MSPEPSLPPTADRRERLRASLIRHDLPAAIVTRLVNVRYLTGFTGSSGALYLDAEGDAVLATDGRYGDQAAAEAPDLRILVGRRPLVTLIDKLLAHRPGGRLGVETHVLTVDEMDGLRRGVPELTPVSLSSKVEQLRLEKDEHELGLIRQACAISNRALHTLIDTGRLRGRSEREVAFDLEARMYAEGADGIAFDTIVAAGAHSAIPHHRPTDARIDAGDLVKIDFGAQLAGYHADCTRTFVVGATPTDWQRELYELVRAAQRAGRHALRPGAALREVDAAARDLITEAGYGERFTHGLGHGVGLEIHEDPFFSVTAEGRLAGRTPVTVEPGVYLAGRGGVRIEDTLITGASGDDAPELLTETTKDLLVLD